MKLSEMIKSNCCGVVLDKQEAIKELQKLEAVKANVDKMIKRARVTGKAPTFEELMELF